ncbi:free fatty acid receptor 3 [Chelmon rostratus]|uniref:free fatty acid receptor 3 n=1 Tax=Chelmon rostratus TaxID=109905 RepID=UPI001BE60487|nr:free fatty acid receptor 3 [Chelmon rostratus]
MSSAEEMQVASKDWVALSVYTFTFLLGLPANLLVLFVYVRKACKRAATPNVVYALNLCMANLALVAWLPVKAMETLFQDWRLPPAICLVYSFFLFSSLYGSCLFLTAVTVGRYLSIAFPIIYKRYRRARLSCVICVALWALVLLHLGCALVAEGGAYFVSTKGDTSVCYDHFNASQLAVLLPLRLEMAIVLFLLPLAVTSFCTLRCVTLVWRSNLRPMGKRRVLAVALTTLAVFVVCYAPYNASHIVGFVLKENVEWRTYAMLTSSCNVFLEPVVMLMLSPAVSRGIVGRICGRQSHFSQIEGFRHQCNSSKGVANVKLPPTLSGKSQAGAEVTKVSQE